MHTFVILNSGKMKKSLLILLAVMLFSCSGEIPLKELKKIDLNVEISRFDQELFSMDTDTIGSAISWFYESYDDFFDVFGFYVIGIGRPTEKSYPGQLKQFITDPVNREVFDAVQQNFADLSGLEKEFEMAFKNYKYYFPNDTIPEVVSFIGGFNYPGFTVSNYLGIGLDMYLGSECVFYKQLGLAEYLIRNMKKDRIAVESLYNWANKKVPYSDEKDNVLSRMVHEGKIIFLLSKLFPDKSIGEILGFSPEAEKWVENNEEQMWVYLIENKLLYSNVLMDIQKLTGPAPYTSFFSRESPGRAAVYNGYSIINEFAKRNKQLSLPEIIANNNYQDILQKSRYNPKAK